MIQYMQIQRNLKVFVKRKKENKLTDRIINLIIKGEEEALFSKTLATIKKDVPIDFSVPEKEWLEGFDDEEFQKICKGLSFVVLKTLSIKTVSCVTKKYYRKRIRDWWPWV